MPWFPLSDTLYRDPRFASLSDAALALWTRASSWSADRLTDGFVPASMLAVFNGATAATADELVEAGVWARARGGWTIVDFPESAKTGAVEARRKADRERQQRKRRSDDVASRRDTRVTPHVTRNESHAESSASYPYSVPTERAPALPGLPDAPVTARDVTARWIDAMRAQGVEPSKGQKGQVSKLAKELLDSGNDPDRVLAAADAAGADGFATIDRSLTRIAGRSHLAPVRAGYVRDSNGRRTEVG